MTGTSLYLFQLILCANFDKTSVVFIMFMVFFGLLVYPFGESGQVGQGILIESESFRFKLH